MQPDHRWDAGELGCGHLAMKLRARFDAMKPGETIEIIARDTGARTDLPAWCRIAGHEVVSAEHPVYLIRRG